MKILIAVPPAPPPPEPRLVPLTPPLPPPPPVAVTLIFVTPAGAVQEVPLVSTTIVGMGEALIVDQVGAEEPAEVST